MLLNPQSFLCHKHGRVLRSFFFVPRKRQWIYILMPLIDKFWLSVSNYFCKTMYVLLRCFLNDVSREWENMTHRHYKMKLQKHADLNRNHSTRQVVIWAMWAADICKASWATWQQNEIWGPHCGEYADNVFHSLRNVGTHLPDYKAPHLRRWMSPLPELLTL